MNYLEKLLDGAQVEWKMLGDVTQYEQPIKYLIKTKNYSDQLKTPVLTAGKTFILGYTDEIKGIYEASKTPVIIFDDFTTANKWVDFDFKAKSSAMKMITSMDNAKFLLKYMYYWINTLPSALVDGDHKRQWIGNFCNKKIPIPCPNDPKKSLAIQMEIVYILDSFTKQTAELTTELKARKKQYNYYRDKLLTFSEDEVEWKKLGEIGELVRGSGLPKSDFVDIGIPAIHYGQIYTYYGVATSKTISFVSSKTAKKLKKVNKGDVIITNTSENFDDVGKTVVYLGEEQAVTGGHATIFKPKDQIIGKYLAYFTQTKFFTKQKMLYTKGTKVIDISTTDISKIFIPIPSLAQQARIVSILDKFDILTNSISEWLQKEIELRQKQYEYYRNLLFNFKKF